MSDFYQHYGNWGLVIIMVVIASWILYSMWLWATLLGYGKIGAIVEMVIGMGLVFFGISLLVDGWREVYYASREGRLRAGSSSAVPWDFPRDLWPIDPLADDSHTCALPYYYVGLRSLGAERGDHDD